MNDNQWRLAKAIWRRDGWTITERPDLFETYTPEGFVPVAGCHIVLLRGLDRRDVYAATDREARQVMWQEMEGR
jgi:hypothetical protein